MTVVLVTRVTQLEVTCHLRLGLASVNCPEVLVQVDSTSSSTISSAVYSSIPTTGQPNSDRWSAAAKAARYQVSTVTVDSDVTVVRLQRADESATRWVNRILL